MLVNEKYQFIRTSFDSESEIESVVQNNAELLFGSGIIYLPQAKIKTIGGVGTIPDAIVIDVPTKEWFIVEAERASHGTWDHIAPQISKQLAAVAAPRTRELILELAMSQILDDERLKTIFAEIGIRELEIHGKLQMILKNNPTVAIPIDSVPKDLEEWARTLRNTVKIWIIEKFVSTNDDKFILYSLPEETSPTLVTEVDKNTNLSSLKSVRSPLFQEILAAKLVKDGQQLILKYAPKGKPKQTFKAIVRNKGIEVDGKVLSPSLAAVYCIQKAGSRRKTANGWMMWKTEDGKLLDSIYKQLGKNI